MKIKDNKGITLIALMTTVTILLIIAGISVYSGKDTIKRANLESLRTNMLLIQAKTREYVEEVSFKMGPTPDETKREEVRKQVYETEALLKKASEVTNITIPSESGINPNECYYIPKEALEKMGLGKIEIEYDNCYLIKFDEANVSVEIYNTKGYEGKYSLTQINQI